MSEYSWTEEGTLYSEEYSDLYFSDGHGLEETKHVFIEGNNITARLQENDLVIGELGFGTGLNFLATWKNWADNGRAHRLTFISCEKHPLSLSLLADSHEHFPELAELSLQLRQKWPLTETGFHTLEFEQGRVVILLLLGDVVEVFKQLEAKVDAWYLDGFTPASNPEMWSEDVFKQIAWHSHKGTTLTSYTAAGFVRRGLKAVGFEISRVKGHGKKLHMTSGVYQGHVKNPLSLKPWFQLPQARKPQRVAVIGAGMAGLNCAWSLSRLGVEVSVYDKHRKPAAEASGNLRGMMFPMISKKPDRLGLFTEMGAAYSLNQFKELGLSIEEGLLEFAADERKEQRFQESVKRYSPDYIKLLSATEVHEKFGIQAPCPAMWHANAVSLSPLEYADALIENGAFELLLNSEVFSLQEDQQKWLVESRHGTKEYDCVVIASACESTRFVAGVPLRKTRGQLLELKREQFKDFPKQGLNFINYLAPVDKNKCLLGATFQPDDEDESLRVEDTQELLSTLHSFFPDMLKDIEPEGVSGRVSFRAMLRDYFPVIGPVHDDRAYQGRYADIKHGKPVSTYEPAVYRPGLYLSTGHGSRGLTLSPLAGAYLARQIVDGLSILPVEHVEAVHPARFCIQKLRKNK